MTSVTRSAPYRTAARRVLRWCAWYTRGLDPHIAAERRDEIASDLHEEAAWAEDSGLSPSRAARVMLLRALRGVAADLSWRSHVLRGTDRAALAELRLDRAGRGLSALLMFLGLGLTGLGLFALIRSLDTRSTSVAPAFELLPVMFLTCLALLGTILSAVRRTRLIGATSLIFPAAWMINFSVQLLWYSSATVQMLVTRLDTLPTFVIAASLGLVLIPAGAAFWWLPSSSRRRRRSTGSAHG